MISGGKIIGVGGQGCIFAPDWTSSTPSKTVLKILESDVGAEEYAIAKSLAALDPGEKYGIYVKGPLNYMVSKKDMEREGLSAKSPKVCRDLANLSEKRHVCALTITKYLNDLDTIPKARITNLLAGLRHLWTALRFFHGHSYVHTDIKAGNVAYTEEGAMVFADWGWAQKINNCTAVDFQCKRMRDNAWYADPGGPWTPLLFGKLPRSCEDRRDLLYFNDVFGLAKFQKTFLSTLTKKGLLPIEKWRGVNIVLSRIYSMGRTPTDDKDYKNHAVLIDLCIKAYNDL